MVKCPNAGGKAISCAEGRCWERRWDLAVTALSAESPSSQPLVMLSWVGKESRLKQSSAESVLATNSEQCKPPFVSVSSLQGVKITGFIKKISSSKERDSDNLMKFMGGNKSKRNGRKT